jgi:cell wall-associated NlpC family hydrolase
MPYSLREVPHHVNCWGLVALVYHNELGIDAPEYSADNLRDISQAFSAAFAENKHGFTAAESPQDFDVIVMKAKRDIHCGIMYKGKILHASYGASSVTYQNLMQVTANYESFEFWRQ